MPSSDPSKFAFLLSLWYKLSAYMPYPPEQPHPRGRGFRLVKPGEPIQVIGDSKLCYFTTNPVPSDAGEVFLEGQGGTELVSPAGRVAFAVRDGRLIIGVSSLIKSYPPLFS
jgi:hypothetical protein